MAGEDGRDVEDDRGLFVSERVLRGGFVSKGIEPAEVSKVYTCGVNMSRSGRDGPGKRDLDVVLIDRKAQIQQL
jgi:hypothetical protein